jgi:hypothetical protein
MTPPTIRRLFPAAIVAATAALALAAGPASAKPIVHQTPKVPLVVDGKKMAPEQIHRFDGKPLYTRVSADGKTLIATTSLAKYKAVLKSKGVTLPRPGAKAPSSKKARTSGAGHWARIWTDNFLRGNQYTVSSGLGVANMNAISGCNWFNCWFFENSVSSVDTYGKGAMLYDLPNFNPYYGSLYIGPNIQADLQLYGFNDRTSSVFTDW